MDVGDTVSVAGGLQGVIVKLPASSARKRPRVLVRTLHGEQWVYLDELTPVETSPTE